MRKPSGLKRTSPLTVMNRSSRPSRTYFAGSQMSALGASFKKLQSSSAGFERYTRSVVWAAATAAAVSSMSAASTQSAGFA